MKKAARKGLLFPLRIEHCLKRVQAAFKGLIFLYSIISVYEAL